MNTKTSVTLDEGNPRLVKAKNKVNALTVELAKAIIDLEAVMADVYYQRAFEDGVEFSKGEINRVLRSGDAPEPEPVKPYVLSDVDRIMQDSIISHITDNPGLRTIDITNKIVTLPVKPALTEKTIRLAVNRLKNSGKIEDKAGRWYTAGEKIPPAQDYKVMRYLEDGSKYLAADVLK